MQWCFTSNVLLYKCTLYKITHCGNKNKEHIYFKGICIIQIISVINCDITIKGSQLIIFTNIWDCQALIYREVLELRCYWLMSLSKFSAKLWKFSTLFSTSINCLSLSGLSATAKIISFISVVPFCRSGMGASSVARK